MLAGVLERFERQLKGLYQWLLLPPPPNLAGDRHVEYSWIAAHLPPGPGSALEFGCGNSYLGLMAAMGGFDVTAVDLIPVEWLYRHPNLNFVQTDIFDLHASDAHFDLIINCSAIEHVGLGRYGDSREADGDLRAMQVLRRLLKPRGTMLLTVPVGQDATFAPLHRVYGPARLPHLLDGYVPQRGEYWVKDPENKWIRVTKSVALSRPPLRRAYGLGCFVLTVARADPAVI
jgi:SAM-dependent methyltransferase